MLKLLSKAGIVAAALVLPFGFAVPANADTKQPVDPQDQASEKFIPLPGLSGLPLDVLGGLSALDSLGNLTGLLGGVGDVGNLPLPTDGQPLPVPAQPNAHKALKLDAKEVAELREAIRTAKANNERFVPVPGSDGLELPLSLLENLPLDALGQSGLPLDVLGGNQLPIPGGPQTAR